MSSHFCRPTLVTFDLGGVIIQLAPSLEAAAQRGGIPLLDPESPPAPQEQLLALIARWETGSLLDEEFFALWTAAHGRRFSLTDAPRLSSSWLMGEFEGISALMDDLEVAGVPTGCLSNTCNHHWQFFHADAQKFPSIPRFKFPFASHLCGLIKPDISIFRAYERATGYRPESIVFFDDTAPNVEGALAAGWKAFHIRRDSSPATQMRSILRELNLLDS